MPRSLAPHPRYAERLRAARERLRLSQREVAAQLRQAPDFLWDLELFDEEVLTSVSLADLAALCRTLALDPALFLADREIPVEKQLSVTDLAAAIRRYLTEHDVSLQAFEDRAGWVVGPALAEPDRVGEWNVDSLYDICELIGIDWVAALPR